MVYKPLKLSEIVALLKNLGEVIVPYNYPQKPISEWGDDLGIFKAREAVIDGYPLYLHYQKSDYGKYFVETLQIHNLKSPFLPFNLICKLGKRFLGKENLSLIEIFKNHKKIYVWSVCLDRQGQTVPIPNVKDQEFCVYEGLQYSYVQPNQVDFF